MNSEQQSRTTSLGGEFVFLSASFPDMDAFTSDHEPVDSRDAVDVVTSLTRAILQADGRLVFGGHPTISPIILNVASDLADDFTGNNPKVMIYQSLYFKDSGDIDIPHATQRLGKEPWAEIQWTNNLGNKEESLLSMRRAMIQEADPVAAIFIGGAEGIQEEYKLFNNTYEDRLVIPIGSTGGKSQDIARKYGLYEELKEYIVTLEEGQVEQFYDLIDRLDSSTTFPRLAVDIVRLIESWIDQKYPIDNRRN